MDLSSLGLDFTWTQDLLAKEDKNGTLALPFLLSFAAMRIILVPAWCGDVLFDRRTVANIGTNPFSVCAWVSLLVYDPAM